MQLPLFLLDIFYEIENQKGEAFIVGGAVRDHLLGVPNKDLDVEVYGLSLASLTDLLKKYGDISKVGKSFGVILLNRMNEPVIEFALPRRENKEGRGYKGFIVELDPTMTLEEAAKRRDFTINSIYFEPIGGTLIDPFGGEADLKNRVLRATSKAYKEDPLRVLRGFQFISRFGLAPTQNTIYSSIAMMAEYDTLSKERIWGEWWKWTTGEHLSEGLHWLMVTSWMFQYPEISNLVGIEQDPDWHPEGDAYKHTLYTVQAAGQIADEVKLDSEARAILIFSALCHDMGKFSTTEVSTRSGRIIARGHAEVSAGLTQTFLMRIGAPHWLVNRVIPLVQEHMFFRHEPTKKSVMRLANRLEPATLEMLTLLVKVDMLGRPPREMPKEVTTSLVLTLAISEELNIRKNAPKPLLMGRHLIKNLKMKPGPQMGIILKSAFEAQLDGEFEDLVGALNWAHDKLEEV